MRLPQSAVPSSSHSPNSAQATTVVKNNKRAVLSGVSCNPYVVKTTPFEFDTATGYGLAFGDQTFHITGGVRINPLNLPAMTAVRQQIEEGSFVTAPALCTPSNFTFTAEQMKPQFVLAANETLTNYPAPADNESGPLVWKMTPFFVDTLAGGFIANGTDNVSARGSNLSLNAFPMQLALRPSIEFHPADVSPNHDKAPYVTAAPTNVYTILPVQPSSDAKIISYLQAPVPTAIASATSTSALLSSLLPSATSAVVTPSATPTSVTTVGQGLKYDVPVAGTVLASVFGVLLLSIVGKKVYDKVKSDGFLKAKPVLNAAVNNQTV